MEVRESIREEVRGCLAARHRARQPGAGAMVALKADEKPRSGLQAAVSRVRASMPIPETMPAYRSFIVSDDASLWVEHYTLPEEQPIWAVFRDEGRYLGDVQTPIGARVTHIGDDFVLVVWEDELGLEQVQMYELIKP